MPKPFRTPEKPVKGRIPTPLEGWTGEAATVPGVVGPGGVAVAAATVPGVEGLEVVVVTGGFVVVVVVVGAEVVVVTGGFVVVVVGGVVVVVVTGVVVVVVVGGFVVVVVVVGGFVVVVVVDGGFVVVVVVGGGFVVVVVVVGGGFVVVVVSHFGVTDDAWPWGKTQAAETEGDVRTPTPKINAPPNTNARPMRSAFSLIARVVLLVIMGSSPLDRLLESSTSRR
jgi:hypothetical protein